MPAHFCICICICISNPPTNDTKFGQAFIHRTIQIQIQIQNILVTQAHTGDLLGVRNTAERLAGTREHAENASHAMPANSHHDDTTDAHKSCRSVQQAHITNRGHSSARAARRVSQQAAVVVGGGPHRRGPERRENVEHDVAIHAPVVRARRIALGQPGHVHVAAQDHHDLGGANEQHDMRS
jgi:hypothetical protein